MGGVRYLMWSVHQTPLCGTGMEVLKEKFTSGNDVPVTRAVITREEYEDLTCFIHSIKEKAWKYKQLSK